MLAALLRLGAAAVVLLSAAVAQGDEDAPAPSLDGPLLAVLNKSGASVSFLDPASGEERARVAVGDGPHEAATAPDGRTVVVCDYGQREPGNTLSVIDVARAERVRTIALQLPAAEEGGQPRRFFRPHGVHFLPGGQRVAVTTELQRTLLIVDITTGAVERALPTRARVSHMVDLDPAGARAYVANIGSGSLSVIDLDTGEFVAAIETGAGAEGVMVHPTRKEVWVTNRAADTISVVDTTELEVLAELDTGGFPIRIAFTPDGARALASCARAGAVEVWDVAERERLASIAMNEEPIDTAEGERLFAGTFGDSPVPVGILLRPDGREAFVANTQADIVTVLDLEHLKIARRLRAGPEPDGMSWVPARAR